MENLLISFNVVAPLILYLGVGMLLRKSGLVDEKGFRGANNIIFYAALPILCMRTIGSSDLADMVRTPFILYLALGILILFALSLLIVPKFCKDDRRKGVMMLGVFRANDAIFGLGVAASLLGENNMALMSLTLTMSVPLFNLLTVYVIERYSGGNTSFFPLLLRILKNPVLIGCLAGIVVSLTGFTFPAFLDKPLGNLASVTTPVAFVTLGGTMTFSAVKKNRTALTLISLLRLFVVPAIFLGAMILLGFRQDALVVSMIIFGAPVAFVAYTMSAAAGADDELAATMVAVTSVLSIVATFMFVFLLKQFAFI